MEIIFSERARKEWKHLERSVQDQLRKRSSFTCKADSP